MAKTRKSSTSTQSMNMTLIAIVIGLILFGLGYVVGRAKAKVSFNQDLMQVKEQLMLDKPFQQTIIDSMMKNDDTRNLMIQAVDDYRRMMKK